MNDLGVNLNRVQIFLEIAKLGSITKTAQLLGLQKSKVSRDLALLEQELGTQLIFRTTRQFNLTADGQKFYINAQRGLQMLAEAVNDTAKDSKGLAGNISITCPEDIGHVLLIPLLKEFSQMYPKITYSIDLSTNILDLVANKIDLAIRPGKLKDSTHIMKKVGTVQFGLFCTNSLYDTLPELNSLQQLNSLPTIHRQDSSKRNQWKLSSKGKNYKIEIQPTYVVNSFLSAYSLVQQGLGISLLPTFIINDERPRNGIVQVLKSVSSESADIQIILPQQKEPLMRVKILSDFLVKKMKPLL